MANRNQLLETFLNKLFKLSPEKYTKIFEEFNIKTLDEIQHFSNIKLENIMKKIETLLKTGTKKMAKHYTGKDFDKEVESLFLKSAVKLEAEEEKKKEEEETPEEKTIPQQEEQQEEEQQEEEQQEEEQQEEEPKTIEDLVKDQQIAILDKFAEVKTFKPGKSEAINFRNSLKKLIEVAESSVNAINEFYQKELGKDEAPEEEDKEKTSASKIAASYQEDQIKRILPADEFGVKIQLSSSKGKTKWMGFGKDVFKAMKSLLSGELK